MKKCNPVVLSAILILVLGVFGCTQRAANSGEAIEQAQAKATVEEQIDYLISQGNAFVNSKEFDEAISVSKYILSKLDKNSEAAKSIVETAKLEIKKLAEQEIDEVKAEVNKKLDGLKGKIGSLGQ